MSEKLNQLRETLNQFLDRPATDREARRGIQLVGGISAAVLSLAFLAAASAHIDSIVDSIEAETCDPFFETDRGKAIIVDAAALKDSFSDTPLRTIAEVNGVTCPVPDPPSAP